ncbi:hypothetical protein ACFL2K_05375, partial [Candidatus Margulisiibacteriota bacterium]
MFENYNYKIFYPKTPFSCETTKRFQEYKRRNVISFPLIIDSNKKKPRKNALPFSPIVNFRKKKKSIINIISAKSNIKEFNTYLTSQGYFKNIDLNDINVIDAFQIYKHSVGEYSPKILNRKSKKNNHIRDMKSIIYKKRNDNLDDYFSLRKGNKEQQEQIKTDYKNSGVIYKPSMHNWIKNLVWLFGIM